jgi:RNA polymerase sigma-70 factor (ECF subfamily)
MSPVEHGAGTLGASVGARRHGSCLMEPTSFAALWDDLVEGKPEAAQQIVDQYSAALVAVARRQIGPKLARRVDAEDVVQSTYRSLFIRARQGEYELGSGREMWKLLVTMTLNKVRRQAKFHRAQRRSLAREQSARASDRSPDALQPAADEPGPDEAAMLVDEVEHLLVRLRPSDRPIVELRLQGHSTSEIAAETGRAERSVRRILAHVQERLQARDDAEA